MNKYDFFMIFILFSLSLVFYFILNSGASASIALVKYDGEIIKEIDLSKPGSNLYEVQGANGKVVIETLDGKIRVIEETSPYNICSKMGWSSSESDIIVCLPNKVVIELVSTEVDTIIY